MATKLSRSSPICTDHEIRDSAGARHNEDGRETGAWYGLWHTQQPFESVARHGLSSPDTRIERPECEADTRMLLSGCITGSDDVMR